MSQRRAALSSPATSANRESGEHATDSTENCTLNTLIGSPVAAYQRRAVWSCAPVRTNRLSREIATASINEECPVKLRNCLPDATSQRSAEKLGPPAERANVPSEENATAVIRGLPPLWTTSCGRAANWN